VNRQVQVVSFVEPVALLFSSLIGVLVAFYLWERWRRRVTVPSLLLWQALREDSIRARRFRPDVLFFAQLLLLSCLILGLAKPYLPGYGDASASRRRILVLDTTASMQMREGRTSRFEEARALALGELHALADADEVMLIAAGASPEVVVNFTRDHAAVARALDEAVPTDTGGDLAVALAFADAARQRSDLPAAVDAFTDIPRSQLPEGLRDTVTVFQVGESDDNIGIQALQVFQGRFQDFQRARAQVLVQNYAHQERHGFLTVQLDDQVVTRTGFTLQARESRGFVVSHFPGPGVVTAHVEVADGLAADDTAWEWIRPMLPVRVLVVSTASPLVAELRELAAATPALELAVVDPAAVTRERMQRADVVIFHRVVPADEPPANALYIHPAAGNAMFPVAAEAENVEVLDWNAAHPALAGLRPLAALPLRRVRIVEPPAWSQILLWSRTDAREFPLAFAGERQGRRVACLTFDLEAEGLLGSDNLNLFLFFMNVLGWLSPQPQDAVVMRTGDVRTLGPFPEQPVSVRAPRGRDYTLDSRAPAFEPLFAGEYRVSSDGTRQAVLANFIDPIESDVGRASKEAPIPAPAPPPREPVRAAAAGAPRQHYGAWLYCAAAALFLLEWLAARRRVT
jgi:hypothetical protein